jgi:hypothetical protein
VDGITGGTTLAAEFAVAVEARERPAIYLRWTGFTTAGPAATGGSLLRGRLLPEAYDLAAFAQLVRDPLRDPSATAATGRRSST